MKDSMLHISINKLDFWDILPAIDVLIIEVDWFYYLLDKIDKQMRAKSYKGSYLIHFNARYFKDTRKYFVLSIFEKFTRVVWVDVENWKVKKVIKNWEIIR